MKKEEHENKGDELVIVSVKDTGIGIDSQIFPRLFEKFATKSEATGTGLGLFISKSIVEAHGGRIWVLNVLHHSNYMPFTSENYFSETMQNNKIEKSQDA